MFQAVAPDQTRGGNPDASPSTAELPSALPYAPVSSGGVSSTASIISSCGNSHSTPSDQQPFKSDISSAVLQVSYTESVSDLPPVHQIPSSFVAAASSNVSPQPQTSTIPPNPFFARPPVLSRTPLTPAPPGLVTSPSAASSVYSSFSSVPLRPGMPTAQSPVNPTLQPQIYPPYHSLPTMGGAPQGMWMQPPTMGGMPRAPFLSHPAAFPGTYPFPARGMPPSAPFSDSQPPGVTPVETTSMVPSSSAASGHQLVVTAPWIEPVTGIDNKIGAQEFVNKGDSSQGERIDAWTAHKTETGVVYYYNVLTGQSTYEKPRGFRGEPDKVPLQPTPVSMEHMPGTDWALVTTNDGKKYYYNSKTKISSWQIPVEVTNLRKKQDAERLTEHSICIPSTDPVAEKRSAPSNLSAPAITNGGRDATALRTASVPGSSSALDLIKKKLQDSGAPSSSPSLVSSVAGTAEASGGKSVEVSEKDVQSENGKDKVKDATGDGEISDSSSDSEDEDSGPTKEECIIQFKEMLKERGVAPFSKWEKELPKIVFDPRFKAIASHSLRRSLFEHYVKTRAEEERREKRAAQRAAIEGFKQLLDEASKDIDYNTDYQTFKRKWGSDPRFEALERKEREALLNERVLSLRRAAEQKAQEIRATAAFSFKSMLRERGDVTINSRWSRMRDSFRNDPRYKSVAHEDREVLFDEYISKLKAAQAEVDRETKARLGEQEKLKERERELRKRKEREEQEMERVRVKVRRKEAIASFQALLVETIKDPQRSKYVTISKHHISFRQKASWTTSKPKLEKDPQGRASNPDLDPSDMEKLFREHIKTLHERCAHDFRALLIEVITTEAASQQTEDGKTVLNSWSTAKRLLKSDPRYSKMPRKDREVIWRRYADEMLRKQKSGSDQKEEKNTDAKSRSTVEPRRSHDRR